MNKNYGRYVYKKCKHHQRKNDFFMKGLNFMHALDHGE